MGKKFEVIPERLDAVDATIMLGLKEGAQSLKTHHVLSGINYNTFRQRLGKLVRYRYIARPCRSFANPEIETFFELSLLPVPFSQRRAGYG